MLLIPAIDIQAGKCVRLRQGNMDDNTVYSMDPVAVAARWVEEGARRLHIVDLDGAKHGRPMNAEIIHEISKQYPAIPIQVGGGIRDEDAVQAYLDAGVSFVILGTKAVTAPHFVSDMCLEFPGRVIVGLDVRDNKVAIDGWSKLSRHDAVDLAQHFEHDGVSSIIFTCINRDGMLNGLNVEETVKFAGNLSIPVIAAGGVTSLDDVRALCSVEHEGIEAAIIGRAIYEGTLDFAAGQALADQLSQAAG